MENSRWNICFTNATQQVRQCGRTTVNWLRYQYNRGRQQFHRTAKQTRSFRGNSNCSATSILSNSTAITTDTTSTMRISKRARMRIFIHFSLTLHLSRKIRVCIGITFVHMFNIKVNIDTK